MKWLCYCTGRGIVYTDKSYNLHLSSFPRRRESVLLFNMPFEFVLAVQGIINCWIPAFAGMTSSVNCELSWYMKRFSFLLLVAFAQLPMIGTAEAVKMPAELVNTWYSFDQPGPFSNLEVFVKWMNDPIPTSSAGVYAGFGFWFQNGVVGYFGTQVDSVGKKAIFSIWDVGTTLITALPTGNCNRFGHEGTGTQ